MEGKAGALTFAQGALKRTRLLHQQKVSSDGELEEALANVEAASKALAEAEAGLSLLRAGSRPEEVRGKVADLEKLKGQRSYQRDRLNRLEIRSPIDGTISTPRMREKKGEAIKAGSDIAEVVDQRNMKINIQVNEREMDALQLGLPVVVRVASPTRAFASKIEFMSPGVEEKDSVRFVRVVASLDNQEQLLRQDMTGYAEIEAGKRPILTLVTRRFTRWIRVRFFL